MFLKTPLEEIYMRHSHSSDPDEEYTEEEFDMILDELGIGNDINHLSLGKLLDVKLHMEKQGFRNVQLKDVFMYSLEHVHADINKKTIFKELKPRQKAGFIL